MIFIHVMLNDICLPCCHLLKTLFDESPVNSDPHLPISTHIIETVYQNYNDSMQNEISAYLDIYTKIIDVMIYEISIVFHPIVIENYCELQWHVQQFLHLWNYKWNKDLQQFSREIWLEISFEIYLHTVTFTSLSSFSSHIQNVLH